MYIDGPVGIVTSASPALSLVTAEALVDTDLHQPVLESREPLSARFGLSSEFAALMCHTDGNQMLDGEVMRLVGAVGMSAR